MFMSASSRKSLFIVLTCYLLAIGLPGVAGEYTDSAIFRENFEALSINSTWFDEDLLVKRHATVGSKGLGAVLKASYAPTERGSRRLLTSFPLRQSVHSATLAFDVMLDEGFEFVRGGKMHGLGGGTITTGCNPIDPQGWSVRMMWNREGVPRLYVYHQNRVHSCGDSYPADDFVFKRNRWYRVEIFVEVNSSVEASDGRAALHIDGKKLVEVENLELTGNSSVEIDTFLFSTFFGGSDDTWSPSKEVHAYFDNFTVRRGKILSGAEGGLCEVFEGGIYNPGTLACCNGSCGSCGGSGCSLLPGGASECCTSSIISSKKFCKVDDVPDASCLITPIEACGFHEGCQRFSVMVPILSLIL